MSVLSKIVLFAALVAISTFWFVGCDRYSNTDSGGKGDGKAANKAVYTIKGDEGVITGTVKYDGVPPPQKMIDMSADANCVGGNKINDETVVTDGKLANVFVYVTGGAADELSFAVPSEPVILDQNGCRYHPRVLGIQTGQTLRVTNSDPTLHNVHAQPKNNRDWNKSQSAHGGPIEEKFERAETVVPVRCNVHSWMRANIAVLAHPFYAVSAEDGAFAIKNLPPGTYTLKTWHETLGERSQTVTIGPKESKAVDFQYGATRAHISGTLRIEPALVLP